MSKIQYSDAAYALFYLAQNPAFLERYDINSYLFDKATRDRITFILAQFNSAEIDSASFASKITELNITYCDKYALDQVHYTGGDNIPEIDIILKRIPQHARENAVNEVLDNFSPTRFSGGDRLLELQEQVNGLVDTQVPADTTMQNMAQVCASFIASLERKSNPVCTGIKTLDALLDGGVYEGVTYIVARPSIGKTIMLHDMARLLAMQGRSSIFFTMEMHNERLYSRWVSRETGAGKNHFRNFEKLSQNQQDRIFNAANTVSKWPIIMDKSSYDAKGLKHAVAMYIAKYGKPDAIFIDYIQLVKGQGDERLRIAEAAAVIQHIYKEYDLPIITASQANRAYVQSQKDADDEKTNPPTLNDCKGSGFLEESADNVITLTRDRYAKYGTVYFKVEKCRDGILGEPVGYFVGARQTFVSDEQQAIQLFGQSFYGEEPCEKREVVRI